MKSTLRVNCSIVFFVPPPPFVHTYVSEPEVTCLSNSDPVGPQISHCVVSIRDGFFSKDVIELIHVVVQRS